MRRFITVVIVSAVLVAVAYPVAGQSLPVQYIKSSQDGTAIPDVNKVNPSDPNDASCWQASAANILAAAGYGTGATAQQKANSIYSQMTAAWGTAGGGAPDQAITWWLANYGKNPSSSEYAPDNFYTDVTAEYRTLTQQDYDFLRGELERCQYVGVQFDSPAHAVTMVGWDHTPTPTQSIWHDSDVNTTSPGDDAYENDFSSNQWSLDFLGTGGQNYLTQANGYTTFCPGLDKPTEAMQNYDVAWHPGPGGPAYREGGDKAGFYAPPDGWQESYTDPNGDMFHPFRINNEFDPDLKKEIYLLVDYYKRDPNYADEDIRLRYTDDQGQEVILAPTAAPQLSADDGQVLFTWELDYQPDAEEILFPSHTDYGMLEGEVAWWDVATICVPEPASLGVVGLVGAVLLRRRRRG
ncbi:MAG: PEP-CTERM sorting domain-containing protein [Planctomycetota bacterium]